MTGGELPSNGEERFSNEKVVFRRPFFIGESSDIYPAGTYEVETRLQSVEAGGHTVKVRTGTVLVIPTSTGIVRREVRGSDLDEAIRWDADQDRIAGLSENPDRGDARIAGSPQ